MANRGYKKDGSVSEEVSAIGERAKGLAKEGWGKVTGDTATEREGERERAEGKARQASRGGCSIF